MRLHLGILKSSSPDASASPGSAESYLPSPADSESFFDNATGRFERSEHASPSPREEETMRINNLQENVPDLRTAKFNFTTRRLQPTLESLPSSGKISDESSIPSPVSQRQDSGSSLTSNPPSGSSGSPSRGPTSSDEAAVLRTASIAFERNSYFRRFSSQPNSNLNNSVSLPLLALVDSARSLLFAVSQIYQSLEHYTIQAIDDRLSSVLRKVLDPANADMLQLIDSLDRFDSISNKSSPPPQVCRAVVESCRDTVAVFGKAISVLSLQLKVIAGGDDVRYLRSMLLVLYGASAEIALAWQNLLPHIEAIKFFIYPSKHNRNHSPSNNKLGEPIPLRTRGGPPRTARRHAGSFSSKDVELGKDLPSYDEPPLPARRVPPSGRRLRSKQAPQVPQTSSSNTLTSPNGSYAHQLNHSRSESYVSLNTSSPSSSPSVPNKPALLDLRSSSKTQVDQVALRAVQEAVDTAPAVWNMIDEMLGTVMDSRSDLRASLERGRTVTSRLARTIRAMRAGDGTADRRGLRADAHVFLKVTRTYLDLCILSPNPQLLFLSRLSCSCQMP
jgi:hypothetical protein